MIAGIYKITSPKNEVYIGQSWNLLRRLTTYKRHSKSIKGQPKLYASITEHGADKHVYEIIYVVEDDTPTQVELSEREAHYYNLYKQAGYSMLNERDLQPVYHSTDEIQKRKEDKKNIDQAVSAEIDNILDGTPVTNKDLLDIRFTRDLRRTLSNAKARKAAKEKWLQHEIKDLNKLLALQHDRTLKLTKEVRHKIGLERNKLIRKRYEELFNINTWHMTKAYYVYMQLAKEFKVSVSTIKNAVLKYGLK